MQRLRTTEKGLTTKIIMIMSIFVLLFFEIGYAGPSLPGTSLLGAPARLAPKAVPAPASPVTSLWVTTYGGSGIFSDEMHSVRQTSDGGYIVAGETHSFVVSGGTAWVMKLDKDGEVVWQKTYGGTHSDVARSVQECMIGTDSDGYIVAGETTSFGDGSQGDAWVFKLDNDGNVVWQKTYGGSNSDSANSIQQTFDGGYIVAGETYSFGAAGGDAWVFKLDADGNVEWQNSYGSSNSDVAYSIQQTSGGGYIVAGLSSDDSDSDEVTGNAFVLKLSEDGTVEWQKSYGGGNYDEAKSIQQTFSAAGDPDGYIVAGETYSIRKEGSAWITNEGDALVFKLDNDGNILWTKSYGGAKYDTANSIQQTSDGGYIVAGETNSFGSGDGAAWFLKLKSDGTLDWQKTYTGTGHDYANSIQQTFSDDGSADGYIVAGASVFSDNLSFDGLVMRLDKDGKVGKCSDIGTSTAEAVSLTTVTASAINMTETATNTTGTSRDAVGTDTKANSSSATMTLCKPGSSIYILAVINDGTGSGNVVSRQKDENLNPVINCGSLGSDCKKRFEPTAGTTSTVTLTASASPNSKFEGWSGGCTGKATTCVVPINNSKTVVAVFNTKAFTITALAGKGGSIAPVGITNPTAKTSVLYGTDLTYIITPLAEYEIALVKVDGKIVEAGAGNYTFRSIVKNSSIAVTFKLKTYNITATVNNTSYGTISNGSVLVKSGSQVSVVSGGSRSFTMRVKNTKLYKLLSVVVDGVEVNIGSNNTFTFNNVKSDHTIVAEFGPKTAVSRPK